MVIYPCYSTHYFIIFYLYCWSDPHYEKKTQRCRQIPELVAKKEQAIIVLRQAQSAQQVAGGN